MLNGALERFVSYCFVRILLCRVGVVCFGQLGTNGVISPTARVPPTKQSLTHGPTPFVHTAHAFKVPLVLADSGDHYWTHVDKAEKLCKNIAATDMNI